MARLVTMAFGLGSVWLSFEIDRRVGIPVIGFVAALLLAISPFFATYAFFVRVAVPLVFVLLTGALLLLKSGRGRRTELVLAAGVFLAIAALFKEVAVLVHHLVCGIPNVDLLARPPAGVSTAIRFGDADHAWASALGRLGLEVVSRGLREYNESLG